MIEKIKSGHWKARLIAKCLCYVVINVYMPDGEWFRECIEYPEYWEIQDLVIK